MATFRAAVGFHFSESGSAPWALFRRVDGSDPAAYEFETNNPKVIARLDGVDGVTRTDARRGPGRPPKVATTNPPVLKAV